MWSEFNKILGFGITIISGLHVVGVVLSLHAVMKARTPQGAIAWALSLITLPYFTVPLYLIFGRGRFHGYIGARRKHRSRIDPILALLSEKAPPKLHHIEGRLQALERLAALPATGGNRLELLRNGREVFPAMLEVIRSAKHYLLLQFYIIRDDRIGNLIADALIEQAQRGVRIYFLYDEIGCYYLSKAYIRRLRDGGVKFHQFNSTKGRRNRFQINFRNHRKIVVCDGTTGIIGGINLGVEYDGESKIFGAWRDTNIRVDGPAASGIQLSFAEDWLWAQGRIPDLSWKPALKAGPSDALVLATGPSDQLDNCSLFFSQSIHAATECLWIASPYFVPDDSVIAALQLAALRGVDVRILIPSTPDHKLVYWASFYYIDLVRKAGVKVFRYEKGFMHQKVMLVDDRLAAIGSANLDNRSFRLNFEITLAAFDEAFALKTKTMLEEDFALSKLVTKPLSKYNLGFRLLVNLARLGAPVL